MKEFPKVTSRISAWTGCRPMQRIFPDSLRFPCRLALTYLTGSKKNCMEVICMPIRRRSWRRRRGGSRVARIAIPLAIPLALALTLGIVIAATGGSHAASENPAALGASASPSDSPSPTPTPSASSAGGTTAAANVNCNIIVPANPFTAQGLATPYQLTGPDGMSPAQSGCTMANAANLGAFVQATILNTRTGQLSVYDPLVVTQGTTPAVAPVVPVLPAHYVATIDFGFNGTDLIQVGATANTLAGANCVNGTPGSIFGQ